MRWIRALVRRLLYFAVVGSLLITPMLSSAATDNGTLLVGHLVVTLPPSMTCLFIIDGYHSEALIGSYSPTGLTGGQTVSDLEDDYHCNGTYLETFFVVTGFSADPGKSWLTSVTCNGVTNSVGSSTYDGYSSGRAQWHWTNAFGLNSKVGTNVSCSIVHS